MKTNTTTSRVSATELAIAQTIGWAAAEEALMGLDNGPDGLAFSEEEALEVMTLDVLEALIENGYVSQDMNGAVALTAAGRNMVA